MKLNDLSPAPGSRLASPGAVVSVVVWVKTVAMATRVNLPSIGTIAPGFEAVNGNCINAC